MNNQTKGLLSNEVIERVFNWLETLEYEGTEEKAQYEYEAAYGLSFSYPEGWSLVENNVDLSHDGYGSRQQNMAFVLTNGTNYVQVFTNHDLSWGDPEVEAAFLVERFTETVVKNTWKPR